MEVCNGYLKSMQQGMSRDAFALGSWASYYNALVSTLERGGCRKRRRVIHTLCNGVCNGCGRGPCYIPPILARIHIGVSNHGLRYIP